MHDSTAFADHPFESRFNELRAWFEARATELGIPGVALGVVHRDFVHSIGFGVTDITSGVPVTTSTAFRVASLTKILTASALVSLGNETNLSLEAPIVTWYPEFKPADDNVASSVTMEQLLSHGAGWSDTPWPEGEAANLTLADVIGDIATSTQLSAPGELFNYSNSSYLLAGHILATTMEIPYEEAIARIILEPLGMVNSGFSRDDVREVTISPGHTVGESGLESIDAWGNSAAVNPAGGLLTTVDDLLRFVSFHAGNVQADIAPLSDAQRLTMREPHGPGGSLGPVVVDAIGLGWMLTNAGSHRVAMSFGSDSGAAAGMAIVADAGFGIVVLANADAGLLLATETLSRACAIFLGTPLAEIAPVALTTEDLQALVGTYEIPGDFAFEVAIVEGNVEITAYAGGQKIPDIGGRLMMLSPVIGSLTVQGMQILIDFVRDEHGIVNWIRFFARLAPRTG